MQARITGWIDATNPLLTIERSRARCGAHA
jgi:hypothetical protein